MIVSWRALPIRPAPASSSHSRIPLRQPRRSNFVAAIEPPYNVVITGSTKGIGRALAAEFVRIGDNVIISSRSDERVRATTRELQQLSSGSSGSKVAGIVANVSKPADVAGLAKFAAEQLGTVDLWVNNAGSNAYKYVPLANASDADLINIVETNVLGVMLCCREAIQLMKGQPFGGHIFNMDGAGADGSATPRFAAYGASKRGLVQLSKSLQAELKLLDIDNVGLHNLSPGMVTTDLLMSGADTKVSKFFINCLAEEPDDVVSYLVPRIRKVAQERSLGGKIGTGSYIKAMTRGAAYQKILIRLFTGARKGRFVSEDE